jgi:hypothetical protein|tara:strand:+ start:3216 stop:3761 length:546 start_codon:yes stop_codon:yes gene_type:complete
MNYILKTMNGDRFTITEEEHKNIIVSNKDIISFSNGITIRRNVIATIFPKSQADEIEDKKNQQTGVLHDGTQVRKHFGQWVDANNQVPDDKGNYVPVKLDPNYYPEITRDCVFLEKEYNEIKDLPNEEKAKILLNKSNNIGKIKNNGFVKISNIKNDLCHLKKDTKLIKEKNKQKNTFLKE